MSELPSLPMLQDEIKKHLPHRDPMLFLDRVTALTENEITTESEISEDAPFFKGHFPGLPIMPGVLIIEMVAQAGALLVALSKGLDDDKFIAFTNVDDVKFRNPVYPNDTIRVDVKIERVRGPFYKFSGEATRGDTKIASLKFAAAQMDFKQDK